MITYLYIHNIKYKIYYIILHTDIGSNKNVDYICFFKY